ncbi:MAG: MFS transporter [Putridiphycobacter sp.]
MKKTYSPAFWMLCIHMLLFFVSFNLIFPELNTYITQLGGKDEKWLILGLWTIAAAISRPFSGKIADNFGRKVPIYIGVLVSVLASFAYPFFLSITGFLVLRFLHGFSTGFQPTGATALVADIIPAEKRGEAMGIFSLTISIGYGLGQYFSTAIFQQFQINGLFVASGLFGLIALSLIFFIKVEPQPKTKVTFGNIIPKIDEVFAPEVIDPTILMFLTATFSGLFYLVVPDLTEHFGSPEKGLYWGIFTISTVGVRFFAGRFADKFGRRINVIIGLILYLTVGLMCANANSFTLFLSTAVLFGIGSGFVSPAIFAWTTDLANPRYKGRGIATMFIALEIGIAFGNFLAQKIYNNDINRFDLVFYTGAFLSLFGLVYLWLTRTKPSIHE